MSLDDSTVTYKPIPGYPGYLVTDSGTVWSCWNSKRTMTPRWRRIGSMDSNGYPIVVLGNGQGKRRWLVSRLVLETFVGPCPEGMQACHFPDPTPANCHLDNLRWDTAKGNMRDRDIHGHNAKGSRKHNAKITEDDVAEMVRLRLAGMQVKDIAVGYGIYPANLSKIFNGRTWAHVTVPAGLATRKRKRTPEEVREARRLSAQGMTHEAIGKKLGFHPSMVCRIVNRKAFADID